VTISARLRRHMWIEELIEIAESEASCELYGILKRPDEKYVTERAYDNPKFVEDMVRDVAARLRNHMWIEELIEIAESEASCELYGILKRTDEKYVTERAYDNPKFVEDLVRDVAMRLNRDDRVAAYVVEAENFESIHNHSAYARIEGDKET
jgi:GTP cyclohydrolase FolE2